MTQDETAQPSESAPTPQKKLNEIHISYFKDATSTEPRDVPISEVIRALRNGGTKSRPLVAEIREARKRGDKDKVGELKKKLPAVTWSGTFSERKNSAQLQHSGLLCADLDKLDGELEDVRAKLRESPHLRALFVSPSGDGLKAVFRVPADLSKHRGSFRAIEQHVRELTGKEIDQACKDAARLCFLSYDIALYVRDEAIEIEPQAEPERPKREINGTVNLSERQRIATELLGAIDWQSDVKGYVSCPGKHLHTNCNGHRDCEVYLDDIPTLHCLHNSCRGIADGVNKELRSRIGKLEFRPEVKKEQSGGEAQSKSVEKTREELQGSDVIFPKLEPWPDPVSGGDVFNEVSATFSRYVVLPDGAADALALWCGQTHAFQCFTCSPRLNVRSPERGCGKTVCRDVVAQFVPRAVLTENLTQAVLFRIIDAHTPAILADEYDRWMKGNEELIGLLNSGHRRGGVALRCEGDGNKVRQFKAYAPAALFGIGSLPGTLIDRSILVQLTRAQARRNQNRL